MIAFRKKIITMGILFLFVILSSCSPKRNIGIKNELMQFKYEYYFQTSNSIDNYFNNVSFCDLRRMEINRETNFVFNYNDNLYYNGKCHLYVLGEKLQIVDDRIRAFDIYNNNLLYSLYDSTGSASKCIIKENNVTIFSCPTESYDLSAGEGIFIIRDNNYIYINCHMNEQAASGPFFGLGMHNYRYSCINYKEGSYINKQNIATRFFRYNNKVYYFCLTTRNELCLFTIYDINDNCIFEIPLDMNYNYKYEFMSDNTLNILRYLYNANTDNKKCEFDYSIIQIDLDNYKYEEIELGNIYHENLEIIDEPKGYCYYNNKIYTLYVRSIYEYDLETKCNQLLCITDVMDKVTGISIINDKGIYIFAETYNDNVSYLYYYDGELHKILIEDYTKRK